MYSTIVSTVAAVALVAVPPVASPGPAEGAASSTCAAVLTQAWQDLGHFSDGMETWMLTTDTCRSATPAAPSASRWSGRPA